MTFLEVVVAVAVGCPLGILLGRLTWWLLDVLGPVVAGLWNDYVRSWSRR